MGRYPRMNGISVMVYEAGTVYSIPSNSSSVNPPVHAWLDVNYCLKVMAHANLGQHSVCSRLRGSCLEGKIYRFWRECFRNCSLTSLGKCVPWVRIQQRRDSTF